MSEINVSKLKVGPARIPQVWKTFFGLLFSARCAMCDGHRLFAGPTTCTCTERVANLCGARTSSSSVVTSWVGRAGFLLSDLVGLVLFSFSCVYFADGGLRSFDVAGTTHGPPNTQRLLIVTPPPVPGISSISK